MLSEKQMILSELVFFEFSVKRSAGNSELLCSDGFISFVLREGFADEFFLCVGDPGETLK